MDIYKKREEIDLGEFQKMTGPFETKYGLPEEIKFCNKCVISNQRPSSTVEYSHTINSQKTTIHFNNKGICDACEFSQQKKSKINWEEREKELKEICNRYRRKDGHYDCLLPGSGGKDSFYAAHILKYKYGMHPLTVTWAPHIYTDWGWKNHQAWIHAGFDNILHTPNGKVHRLLTRLAVENLYHPFQPFIIGQKALAPKIAIKYNIKLIFFGENEAEYGNPIHDNLSAKRDWIYFTSEDKSKIFLGGTSLDNLQNFFGIDNNDLYFYLPENPEEIEKGDIVVHYLGFYLKWHPQRNYFYAAERGGFQASPERTPGTYSKYNSIDDKVDDLHYFTTYIKFGIGRATYDASQEIRSGDLTREEGIALVKRYDGEFPDRFVNELFEYLSITPSQFQVASKMFEQPIMNKKYFLHLADRFRSPHLWKYESGKWKLRHKVWDKDWTGSIDLEEEALSWNGNIYRSFKA